MNNRQKNQKIRKTLIYSFNYYFFFSPFGKADSRKRCKWGRKKEMHAKQFQDSFYGQLIKLSSDILFQKKTPFVSKSNQQKLIKIERGFYHLMAVLPPQNFIFRKFHQKSLLFHCPLKITFGQPKFGYEELLKFKFRLKSFETSKK